MLCNNFFHVMFFFKFLHSLTLCNCLCFYFFCKFLQFLRTLSSFMLQHISQNTKLSWNNFECKEVWSPFPPPIFLFKVAYFFCIKYSFFSNTPFISWWSCSCMSTWKQLLFVNGSNALWFSSFIHIPSSPSFPSSIIIFATWCEPYRHNHVR